MAQVDLLEWLNRNSFRAYPITENSNRIGINTGVKIPDNVMVDAFIATNLNGSSVYVSAVCFTLRVITVVFARTDTQKTIGSASVVLGVDQPYTRTKIESSGAEVFGSVTFGSILDSDVYKDFVTLLGTHYFSTDHILEAHCCVDLGEAPVISMAADGRESEPIFGDVDILTNDQITVTASEQVEDGDIVTYLVFDLNTPEDFLPICERPSTVCDCEITPIRTINGIEGPNITIELVDVNGVITNVTGLIQLLVTRKTDEICVKTLVADQYGRLPPSYSQDCPPITSYGSDPGPSCSS